MKDIFIDNDVAKNFSNPLDPEYKKLVACLIRFDSVNVNSNLSLVISNKILSEYMRTSGNASSSSNIVAIINQMTKQGRLVKITNEAIKLFKRQHFTNKVLRHLRCNEEDRDHIPTVLLSNRKFALSLDDAFIHDVTHFPSFQATVVKRPEDLFYDAD